MAKDRWRELCKAVELDDGLVTRACGSWTEDKLYLWHRYLDITTTAMVGKPQWKAGLVYVDAFAGPGVCKIRETEKRLPGSPLIAAHTPKAFTQIWAIELDPTNAAACQQRLKSSPAADRSHVVQGDCSEAMAGIAAQNPRGSLTLAMIDPEGLDVEFGMLQTLANGRAVDFLLLFADATDLIRNVDLYEQQLDESKLDKMLGPNSDWRTDFNELANRSAANLRALFPRIYERQLKRLLGYEGIRTKQVTGPRGPMYTLLYASKHERGLDFWDKTVMKDKGGQTDFGFGT